MTNGNLAVHGGRLAAVYLLLMLVVSLTAASASGMGGNAKVSWSLGTADTRVILAVDNSRLTIKRLATSDSSHNWAGEKTVVSLMPRVWQANSEFDTDLIFQGAKQDRKLGTLVLTFSNARPKMTLRSIWTARPGHGPVQHRLEIVNQSGQELTVSHQDSLSLFGLSAGGSSEVWLIRRGGSNASSQGGTYTDPVGRDLDLNLVSDCLDGSSPVPWAAVQVNETRGLYVGWEFSGLGRVRVKSAAENGLVDISVGNKPDFRTAIGPGETFHVPQAFVGCYEGDVEQGSYLLHRFVIEKLRLPMAKGIPDPVLAYNVYFDGGGAGATQESLLKCARTCFDFGFEAFMPDAMWYPETGDWRWDPGRFPNGAGPIEQYVHQNGMRMALWCAWTNGGISEHPEALSVRGPVGHPDWFNAQYGPDWRPGPFTGGKLCLGCEQAKAWATEKTRWLVSNHRLDYLKHDIDPIATSCDKSTHKHRYGVDVSYWAALGYYEVQEKLRRSFPTLVLENCSGGGHIKDFGVVSRTHYTVTTDTLSALPDRQSIYDSTYALPPLVLQAYTVERAYAREGDDPESYLWRSAMMGAWQIDPKTTSEWTDAQRAKVKQAVQTYKTWVRPILRDCKVYHVLPRPDGKNWDGMFYYSSNMKKGTLYIFRPKSEIPRQTVKLKGLSPSKAYRVWSEDGSIQSKTVKGSVLMNNGLEIALPADYTSDLIFVQET